MPVLPKATSKLLPYWHELHSQKNYANGVLREILNLDYEFSLDFFSKLHDPNFKENLRRLDRQVLKDGGVEVSEGTLEVLKILDGNLLSDERGKWKTLPLAKWLESLSDEKIPGRKMLMDLMKQDEHQGFLKFYRSQAPGGAKKAHYIQGNYDWHKHLGEMKQLDSYNDMPLPDLQETMRRLFQQKARGNDSLFDAYQMLKHVGAKYEFLSSDEQKVFNQFKALTERATIGFEHRNFQEVAERAHRLHGLDMPLDFKSPHPTRWQNLRAEINDFLAGASANSDKAAPTKAEGLERAIRGDVPTIQTSPDTASLGLPFPTIPGVKANPTESSGQRHFTVHKGIDSRRGDWRSQAIRDDGPTERQL